MSDPKISRASDGKLQVIGELNFETVPQVWKTSQPLLADSAKLQFDLSGVTHSNSAGLALLLEWIKSAKRQKKSLTFENIPQQLMSIAKVTGVEDLLSC